jgi:glyoxylate reductase
MRNYHDPAIAEFLGQHCDVDVYDSHITPPHDVTMRKENECDAFLPEGIDIIDAEVLDNATRLKVIGNRAVGTDNVDIPAATRNGVLLTNTPGILQDACADMTFALLLSAARQVTRSDRDIRAGEWTVFNQTPWLGLDAYNKTLGIFGFGGIGQKVAKRAAGFDMRVIYLSRTRKPEAEQQLGAEWAGDLETLLKESDYVSFHCPLTDETRGVMGEAEFGLMKSTAILVNMARGPVVQPKALYDALSNKTIAGAAIDVTDPEPIPLDDPLLALDNLIVTPHIGSASAATFKAMGLMASRNIIADLNGEPAEFSVNPEALANR